MKTSAIAAQLFEPATAQTQRGASAASTAEFSQLLANARSAAFSSPMGEDCADLVSRRRDTMRTAEQPRRQDDVQERPQASQPRDTQRAERRSENRAAERADDTAEAEDSAAAEDTAETVPVTRAEAPAEQTAATSDNAGTTTEPAATPAAETTTAPTTTTATPATDTTATDDPSADALAALNTVPTTTEAPVESPAETAAGATAAAPVDAAVTQPAATAGHAPAEAASDVARAAVAAAQQQTSTESSHGADVSAAVHQAQQQSAADMPAAETTPDLAAQADAAAVTVETAAPQVAAAATKTTDAARSAAPQQGQAAELAGLANGAGLTVKSNGGSASAPKTDLVSGSALMAQAVDDAAAEAGAFLNGDAADQFLMNDQARAALANAIGRVEQASGNALASKPFAAVAVAAAEAAAPTSAANATTTSQPIAGIGTVGATGAASPTGVAQAASHAHGPQVPAPVQQVSTALASALSKGQDSISVQMNPDELGRVDITLDFQDGRVSATIVADKPETLEMLQKDARTLEKMLSDAGLRTDQQSLNFSLRGDNQQNQQLAREERASRSRAQLLAIDDGAGSAPTLPQNRARTTLGGLDISV